MYEPIPSDYSGIIVVLTLLFSILAVIFSGIRVQTKKQHLTRTGCSLLSVLLIECIVGISAENHRREAMEKNVLAQEPRLKEATFHRYATADIACFHLVYENKHTYEQGYSFDEAGLPHAKIYIGIPEQINSFKPECSAGIN